MIDQILNLMPELGKAFWETFQMVGISLSLALLLGVPIGLLLFITDKGLFWENKIFNTAGGGDGGGDGGGGGGHGAVPV